MEANSLFQGHYRKGAALTQLKRYSEAVDAYRVGLEYEPTNQDVNKALSNVEEKLSKLIITNLFQYIHAVELQSASAWASTVQLVIFAGTNFTKRAKIMVSEIFAVLIFAFGESGTRGLASCTAKS